MLRSPEWANWLDAKQRSLWIHGIPGAGKTILMSYLVEQIKQHCKHIRPGKCAYVYYYCYFAHDQDETAPLLRWLLNQLCRQADVVPDTVFTMYKYGGEPGVVELLGALEDILEMFEVTYVVVDALDESSLPREELLRTLQGIATSPRFEKLQLLTSSREYIDIERFMSQFSMSISMANPFVEDDIRVYVRSLLRSSNKFRRWPQELLDEVEQTISTGAKGMYVFTHSFPSDGLIVDIQDRFRWAVCQLDILQRLNCERRVVEKALKNLPKTLDESYDRILLAIPEEEQVIVHHILQWIHYHNELYDGQSIPCELLVQGVRKSTAKLSADHMERFYDTETLLEVCGCLISLVAENRTEIRGQETLGFSFAHYTVREYLDSNRVSPGSTAYSITYMKDLTQEVLGIVLHEAHSFKPNPLWEIGDDDSTHRIGTMAYVVEDFNVYCSASALLSLCKLQHEIAEQDTLYALGISLLDPSKPHFQILRDAAWCIRPLVEWFSRGDTYDAGQFWEVRWNAEPSNIDASLLLSLLFLTYRVWEGLPLAKKFLEGKTARSCLQTRLHFDYFAISEYDKLYYIFDGSVIEVFAQLRFAEEELELLLEYGMGLFDPSKILILIIGCRVVRREQSSEKVCLVQRLLGLGADPDMRGYRVSPLQIAVRRWDFVAVSKLLEGGADPNNTGNSNGVIWRERKIMTRFDCLHNASPLYICRHYKDIAIDFRKEDKEVNQPKIEAILLQYQAKAFKRSLPA